MTFITESGSVYELDPQTKLVRGVVVASTGHRLSGGQWRRYEDYVQLPDGRLVIELADAELLPDSPDCAIPCVITSRIVEVRA